MSQESIGFMIVECGASHEDQAIGSAEHQNAESTTISRHPFEFIRGPRVPLEDSDIAT